MADVWEKNLAQKSSLTTSDFIRVVGSDNVSYKQVLSAVSKTIANYELNVASSASAFNSGDDLNDFKTAGAWRSGGSASSASIVNTPTTTAGYLLLVLNLSSSFTVQIAITANSPSVTYKRAYRVSNSTWSAWEQIPTRAEVDALNSITDVSSAVTSDVASLTINSKRVVRCGKIVSVYILFKSSTALANYTTIFKGLPVQVTAMLSNDLISGIPCSLEGSGNILNQKPIPADTYVRISMVYLAAN